jgi:hypothetical protein
MCVCISDISIQVVCTIPHIFPEKWQSITCCTHCRADRGVSETGEHHGQLHFPFTHPYMLPTNPPKPTRATRATNTTRRTLTSLNLQSSPTDTQKHGQHLKAAPAAMSCISPGLLRRPPPPCIHHVADANHPGVLRQRYCVDTCDTQQLPAVHTRLQRPSA